MWDRIVWELGLSKWGIHPVCYCSTMPYLRPKLSFHYLIIRSICFGFLEGMNVYQVPQCCARRMNG